METIAPAGEPGAAPNGRTLRGGSASAMRGASLAVRSLVAAMIVAFFISQSFYDHAADFKTFFSAGYAVRHPEIPLYDLVALDENPFGEVFKLPPPAAVMLVPFSFGTIQQARLAWRIVLVAAFVAAYALLARAFNVPLLGWAWLGGLAAWAVVGPLQIAVGEGQWDPIFLLLVVAATVGTMSSRPVLAALAVALAASIKPYPLILAGYFLARGWWRALGTCVIGLAAILIAGATVVGIDETMAFATRVLPASGATTAYADNQALGGVLARLWTADLKPTPVSGMPSLDLAIRAVSLAFIAVTVWMTRRRAPTDGPGRALQFALFVPLAVLAIPAAWSHYHAILLVPLSLLVIDQVRHRPCEAIGWLLIGAAFVLLVIPNPTMLYGLEIDRGLWLRSRADGANLALQRQFPTELSRLILSYKAFGAALIYGLVAWRISSMSVGSAHRAIEASASAVPGRTS